MKTRLHDKCFRYGTIKCEHRTEYSEHGTSRLHDKKFLNCRAKNITDDTPKLRHGTRKNRTLNTFVSG